MIQQLIDKKQMILTLNAIFMHMGKEVNYVNRN